MATEAEHPAFDVEVTKQAAENWQLAADDRERKTKAIAAGRYTEAEDRGRLAAHANRLLRRVRRNAPADPRELPPLLREEIARGGVAAARIDDRLFEAIIGETRDFLAVGFLEAGLRAAQAVGRVVVRPPGKPGALGTGFLISPRVMLTNHHVLHDESEAAAATLQMGFDVAGGPNQTAVQEFALRPDAFFVTDKALDFTIVAVSERAAGGAMLASYGFLPLIAEEGKIVVGRPINIIQHPRGRAKEIVIRENTLLDLPATPNWAAHYSADTEPGSSGSPVFNDSWEVVALHHSGVPKMDAQGRWLDIDDGLWKPQEDPARIAWAGNEGIRTSRLIGALTLARVTPAQRALRDEVLRGDQAPLPEVPSSRRTSVPVRRQQPEIAEGTSPAPIPATALLGDGLTVTVPLVIRLSLGGTGMSAAMPPAPALLRGLDERLEVDPDYDNRPGFDPDFCGFRAPLPTPGPRIADDVARTADGGIELRYHHYSVVMNATRRLAFVSAVNLDADAPVQSGRAGSDRWVFDPRIARESQAGNEFYADNPLDRGHLTRRLDAAWGRTTEEAKRANDDTFHFTNCSPQHEVFNQSGLATRRGLLLWGNLENHILDSAELDQARVSIFNGPIFGTGDRTHRGLQIPRQFFKAIALREAAGRRAVNRVFAFILAQENLIQNLPEEAFTPDEIFSAGAFRPFQVSLAEVERRTGLVFDAAMRSADVMRGRRRAGAQESAADDEILVIRTLADLWRPQPDTLPDEAPSPPPVADERAPAARPLKGRRRE